MTSKPDPDKGSRVWTELVDITTGVVDNTALSWRTGPGKRPSDEYLASEGFYGLVRAPQPSYNPRTHRLVMQAPSAWVRDDRTHTVVQDWNIVPLTLQEQQEASAQQMAVLRMQRDQKLTATDYTQLVDYTGDKAAWATYRQALRDLPSKTVDPFNVQWPKLPTGE